MLRRRTIVPLVLSIAALAATAAAQEFEGELRDVTEVGFQQLADGQRFFVRTNEPATYRVESLSEDVITLVLDNTRVSLRNNSRHLDTRYFEGPVTFIQPKVIE